MGRLSQRKQVVEHLQCTFRISQRRGCAVTIQHRSTQRYRSCKPTHVELRSRIKEIAAVRVRYGYRRIQVLLRREAIMQGSIWYIGCTAKKDCGYARTQPGDARWRCRVSNASSQTRPTRRGVWISSLINWPTGCAFVRSPSSTSSLVIR